MMWDSDRVCLQKVRETHENRSILIHHLTHDRTHWL